MMPVPQEELKQLLESLHDKYNHQDFIADDPVLIPHRFSRKEDVEISGFFTAMLAWGGRKAIIRAATALMALMEDAPYDFVVNHTPHDLSRFTRFVYRTMQPTDIQFLVRALKRTYIDFGGLEQLFGTGIRENDQDVYHAISLVREKFLETAHEVRSEKHLANPLAGSAAKRINLFLRWMVRSDSRGVDFGIWKAIRASQLVCPLDVHTGNASRALGLISRNANDRVAALQLTQKLKEFDPEDPVKYDFALFGLGMFQDSLLPPRL